MLKWLIVLFAAVFVVGRLRGREYSFPFASAVVFSLIAGIIGWLL
jgi:hypothetical protein